MTYVVLDPPRSETSDQPLVAAWRVNEGDHVERGQTLANVRVRGATVDVPAPHAGLIDQIFVPAGEHFPAGHPLARLVVF
jgi:pyruvate dehydrogenase E2 component (dihydrolipoamide acetyltransferase)